MDKFLMNVLPAEIKKYIVGNNCSNQITEIRMRVNKPLCIVSMSKINTMPYVVTLKDISYIIERACNCSVYAFEDEIKQGFITIKGGHRLGIAGQAVLENGRIKTVKNISFLNLRVAHQLRGCANKVMPYITNNNRLLDTLIISPPGCGKTTMLRDIVKCASDGCAYCKELNISIVDERSELAACYMGVPQNDIGEHTDVLDACPKAQGMVMLLRSMNPSVIAVDEIGSREDIDAIYYVINSGCKVVATVHGESIDDIRTRPILRRLVEEKVFERYVVLGDSDGIGSIEAIFDERGNDLLISLCLAAY